MRTNFWAGRASRVFYFAVYAALLMPAAASAQTSDTSPPQGSAATARRVAGVRASSGLSWSRWASVNVDDAVPPVAPEVPCSLPQVLEETGKRIQELVASLQQFTAIERIEHREADRSGAWRAPKTRSVHYLAFISEVRPGWLSVDEARNGADSLNLFPTKLASRGTVALALIFHPYYVEDFVTVCEGLGQWNGQPAWQVHFRQRADKPSRIRGYRVKNKSFPVKLKGRAWIAADNYQVLHIETDLDEPLSLIRLAREHQVIDYGPVPFKRRNLQLWLPHNAELYIELGGHRYCHRHSFSDFELFSVDVTQQIRDPQ